MWLRNRGFRYENNLGTSKSSVRAYFLRDRESTSDHANGNQRSFALFVVPFVSISTKKVFPLKYEKQNKKKKKQKNSRTTERVAKNFNCIAESGETSGCRQSEIVCTILTFVLDAARCRTDEREFIYFFFIFELGRIMIRSPERIT